MPSHPFPSIVIAHLARYPQMQPADLYKLAHQATLGSEHAVSSEATARAWLYCELAEMGSGPDEPLLDVISGDGQILRCHLRPYLQGEHDPEDLLQAFMQTAKQVRRNPGDLRASVDEILRLSQAGQICFGAEELGEYFNQMESTGWPAVHHSDEYLRAYHPAYRVIAREFLPRSIHVRGNSGHC